MSQSRPRPPTPPRPIEAWLGGLGERIGASRWSIAVREPDGWRVRSAAGSLRDAAVGQITADVLAAEPDRPRLLELADLGDTGERLRASGVDRLLALPAGTDAWLFFDSPDRDRALDMIEAHGSWPPPDLALLLAAEDASLDLQELTAWWLGADVADVPRLRTSSGSLFANQLQVAARSVVTTGDETRRNALLRERARIASVIHEGITQVLTNVSIQLEVLGHAADDPDTVRHLVGGSREAVLQALDSLRSVIFDLTPPAEEWTDLVVGLRGFVTDFASQWGVEVGLDIVGEPREVAAEFVALAFAFVQEGLTNVRKHAGTSRADVTLTFGAGVVTVEICDDGVGVEVSAAPGDDELRRHQGLSIMASHVRLMSGRMYLDTPEAGGTSLRMEVPA